MEFEAENKSKKIKNKIPWLLENLFGEIQNGTRLCHSDTDYDWLSDLVASSMHSY
ncbi:MAG: hypothetical protein ACK52I_04540 [Pseudomonadota bacterium]